jgi:hypothetical protein
MRHIQGPAERWRGHRPRRVAASVVAAGVFACATDSREPGFHDPSGRNSGDAGAGVNNVNPPGGNVGGTANPSGPGGNEGGNAGLALDAEGGAGGSNNAGDAGSNAAPPVDPFVTLGEAENSGADCALPALPEFAALPEYIQLHDPFTLASGSRMTQRAEWICRRAEIGAQLQRYELGPKPPKPASVSASSVGNQITVFVSEGGAEISFTATVTPPATGTAPYPALITVGPSTLQVNPSQLGLAVINFNSDDIAAQTNRDSRGVGKFYTLYGQTHAAGALMAWAWGISRLIDAIETLPEANIDPDRLGVTGCSRYGRGALVAGAFDERIALTLPQDTGVGGVGPFRIAEYNHNTWLSSGSPTGQDVQTLQAAALENVWFTPSFDQFGPAPNKLPLDQHLLLGLVAPRAMLVLNNSSLYYLDRVGSHAGPVVAHEIWEALGVPDAMGTSQVGDRALCAAAPAQTAEATAYIEKFLIGTGTGNTNVLYSSPNFAIDDARWLGWRTPVLE